jgi:hypothetical protein
MNMLTRQEFADHFNALDNRLAVPDSPLWIPDDDTPSEWFVCVKPIGVHRFKFSYYDWCNKTLKGQVRCYSSSSEDQQEWWGFTHKEDIVLWTLKWM